VSDVFCLNWTIQCKPFNGRRFAPIEQYQKKIAAPVIQNTMQKKVKFSKKLAFISPLDTLQFRDDAEEVNDKTDELEGNQSRKYISKQTTADLENLKLLMKNVFFFSDFEKRI
jgi:hypothetical protein